MPNSNGYATGFDYDQGTNHVSRQTQSYDSDGNPNGPAPDAVTTGHVYNGLSYGGYAATVSGDPNGAYSVDTNRNGLNDAIGRYQGMGAAAAQRGAYHADYGAADWDMQQARRSRGREEQALQGLGNAAHGNAPSMTTGIGRAMADQSLQGQLGAAAGARGGLAQAAQSRMAYGQAAAQGAGNAGSIAGMRAGELSDARGAYMGGAGAMRGQDFTSQNMLQHRAILQGDSELAQREMNQHQQMGMEGLAYGARQAQLGAQQKQAETDAGIYGNNLSIQQQEKNRTGRWIGAGAGAGGSLLSGLGNYVGGDNGGNGGGGGGSGYQGAPIQRDDPYASGSGDDGSDPYGGIGR